MDTITSLKSMLTIELDIDDYNILALNDIVRMFVIQFVVQILFFLRNDKVELFSMVFIENTLFILLGVFVYWMIFNNIILFTNKPTKDKDPDKDPDKFYQNIYSLN
tara:strand:- start:2493 stop:2810 length:318 start_codon:yes stop_codon:yes gene_type:complete